MENKIPRPEHPNPQFKRENWQSLNGEWNFAFDDQNQGEKNKWYQKKKLENKIIVPFTFETEASGIADRREHNYIWYQRSFDIEAEARQKVILNFGAVDYLTKVWINGSFVGSHIGGYDSFSFDISDFVSYQGKNKIIVKVEDSRSKTQPRGKQTYKKDNFLCWYTRTTGIWQTVWLEFMDQKLQFEKIKITPDIDQKEVELEYNFKAADFKTGEYKLLTEIKFEGKLINKFEFKINKNNHKYKVNLDDDNQMKLWSPEQPDLYDLKMTLYKGMKAVDQVNSYFGMRKISIEKDKIYLNNQPLYQKLILDQGYWPESLMTPPSDQALKKDVELIKKMGFNGARKHQKIEADRFYYWADKLGILVWAEIGSTYEYNDQAVENFSTQWLKVVQELYNHPSIITWVPFNESWGIEDVARDKKQQSFTESIYYLTRSIDPHRPIIANDGWEHTISDIITFHDYVENTDKLRKTYVESIDQLLQNKEVFNDQKYIEGGKFIMADNYCYQGQPIIFSEFGGIAFQNKEGWGYGEQVESKEELSRKMKKLMEIIKEADYFKGYCYTQLTDVEQEKNGLLDENREFKLDLEKIIEFNQIVER
ncbi:glycosyl hydrolase family 2 [Halanaerobium saccharolyticum]|uniref:Glycosyl hydrolase family 2 n=1 Tax=Halanaerobium saccharolyticum TaxID=43595 RepID=A0A4R7Z505_9FIRM|nr:sugar-binding domain-containing protein [Halanaerobium saccharolyticum]RAK12735.1 glycosyl hydrolase family 2 [Halanaerobium saccharolyticum]TDW02948.1 glycosyl hydrolase family 2 [Halanaerobium saccharolyticum]TDX62868.1 glycosyl hydrolase family 2 [Halanaerobium saccharolyticum]